MVCGFCASPIQRAQEDLTFYEKAADDAILKKFAARRDHVVDPPDVASSSSAPQPGKYAARSESQDPTNFGPDKQASERSQIASLIDVATMKQEEEQEANPYGDQAAADLNASGSDEGPFKKAKT
eukprot:13249743-Heterocapsa_arctica.AAC.1